MNIKLKDAIHKGRKGDYEAFAEIFNATNQMVYYKALKILKNESDAQDIVQEAYIKVFQNIDTLQNEGAFPGWLKVVTANLCKNQLKKRNPVLFQDPQEQEQMILSITELNEDFLPEEYVQKQEKSRLVLNIIDELPDLQRSAVILYYYDELSVQEIADIMETSANTIKSRLNYARKKIKNEVEKLERRDIKLYSASGIPVIAALLRNDAKHYILPESVSNSILYGGTATQGIVQKFIASSLATKIIAGVAAVGIVAGAAFGIPHAIGGSGNNEVRGSAEYQQSDTDIVEGKIKEVLRGRSIEELLGLPKSEITPMLGQPDEMVENDVGEIVRYNYFTSEGSQMLEIGFYEDITSDLVIYRGDFQVLGIRLGDSIKQIKETFSGKPVISSSDEIGTGNYYSTSKFFFENLEYEFYYMKEDHMDFFIISLPYAYLDSLIYGTEQGTIEAMNIEPAKLFGKTEEEIVTLFGEPYRVDLGNYIYRDVNGDELEISFEVNSKTVMFIDYEGSVLTFDGLQSPIGKTEDYIKDLVESDPIVEKTKDEGLPSTANMFSFYRGDNKFTVYSIDGNEIYLLRASKWERSEEQQKHNEELRNYFIRNYRTKNAQAFFADLTHDGKDEMIVVYGDGWVGNLDVIKIDEQNQGKLIYSVYSATTSNDLYDHRLYTENGKAYLLSDIYLGRQGYPMFTYSIVHLSETGEEVVFAEKTVEAEYGNEDGISEAELDGFNKDLYNRISNSTPLLTHKDGYLVYGKGENFTSGPNGENLIALDGLILQDDTTIFTFLGETNTNKGWERVYNGLEITSNQGAWDSFHITSDAYTVCGVYVGQNKQEAIEQIGRSAAKKETTNNKLVYVVLDKPQDLVGIQFIVQLYFSGDTVSELYYQAIAY